MWNREYHRWHSPSLGRDMELLLFGHGGAKLLLFPTSQGSFFENEDRGLVAALGDHLRNGWLQVCCVDSVDAESWYARWKHPHDRAVRQSQYDAYLRHEVLPFLWHRNPTPFLITSGASFGAYHAANFGFRHPDVVNRVIGMSGVYNIKEFTGGYDDHEVYVNDPSHFVLHESHPAWLEAMRRQDIILVTGRDDAHLGDTEHLSRALWGRGIGNALRIWDGWAHDWPWWKQMIRHYIGGHD